MLSTFQEALVALATDGRWRARLRQSGAGAFESLSLDATERRALAAIPIDAIERYAHSLLAKRWDEVARTVPLTRRVVPELERTYHTWAEDHAPLAVDTVLSPGAAEAQRALPALRRALSSPRHCDYAADLLAFEVFSACSRADRSARWLSSRWDMGEIAREIAKGLLPIDPPERPTHFRFDAIGTQWRRP